MNFSPSLMCMDFLKMKEQIETLNNLCSSFHIDIMDGHYVKNITLSPDFVFALSKVSTREIDCHLMVEYPQDYLEILACAKASCISVHAETINAQAFRIIDKIKSLGCKVGIVLNPATPLSYIEYYIEEVDKLTIMSVDVGYAGQPFITQMLQKIELAAKLKKEKGYKYTIQVDGSCNKNTFASLYKAGAQELVVGSSGLFSKDKDVKKAWEIMQNDFTKAIKEVDFLE